MPRGVSHEAFRVGGVARCPPTRNCSRYSLAISASPRWGRRLVDVPLVQIEYATPPAGGRPSTINTGVQPVARHLVHARRDDSRLAHDVRAGFVGAILPWIG